MKEQIKAWWARAFFILCLWPMAAGSIDDPKPLPPDRTPLPSAFHCPVDGESVQDRSHGVLWHGRRYYMDREACQAMFMKDPERFVRKIEPRAALFSPSAPDRPSYGPAVLYLAIWVVIGLLSGGATSYVAVQKGLSGRNWFLIGFVLNVIGIGLVLRCRGREMLFGTRGLCKTPQTYEPVPCSCGKSNHPSATECTGCGRKLQPSTESDVARAS